jgi:endoglucanase
MAAAATTTWLTPRQMQARMGLGINLGNRVDLLDKAPREVKRAYFQDFRAKGFQNVRIPVCWDTHTAQESPYTVNASWLDQVETYVDWSLASDLVVIPREVAR